jgi:hypothetical protein
MNAREFEQKAIEWTLLVCVVAGLFAAMIYDVMR